MWLLVVAAGSGYLARCLQSKRPRLNEHEGGNGSSFGSPQEANHTLCEEALQVKDRFEKLTDFSDDKGLKRSCCGSSSDVMEGRFMPLTSFQRGVHDVKSPSKLACKSKSWPVVWPSRVRAGEGNINILQPANECQPGGFATNELRQEIQEFSSRMDSDEEMASFPEKHESLASGLMEKEARQGGSSVHIDVSDVLTSDGKADVTVITPLGDVSWRASREDAERLSLGDLPNILDWTSMAASQKHLLFGPDEEFNTSSRGRRSFEGKKKTRGARSRSKDPSGPSTPVVTSAPTLPALASALRKRKAGASILHGYHDPGSVAKEVLLFGMGLQVGLCCMLFYHKSEMEKVHRLFKQPSFSGVTAGRKLFANLQADDDNESTASVVTVETKPDQMAMLEAELEAELEIMQMNLNADEDQPSNTSLSRVKVENTVSPVETQEWALSPRELDRRLRLVLEERQAKEIEELQAELQEAARKLHMKEEELRSWKDRVYSLTEVTLPSPTEDNALVEAVNCESPLLQRPPSRRRWFSDEADGSKNGSLRSQNAIHASLPSLVSAVSSCRLTEMDDDTFSALPEAMERLSLGGREHAGVSRSCVTVSNLLQGVRQQNGDSRYAQPGMAERRSSLGTNSSSSHVKTQVHEEHLVFSAPFVSRDSSTKLASDCQQSQVIRTVETNYRVEERHYHGSRCQDSHEGEEKWLSRKLTRPRHSTGNLLAGRQRSQRQRRRWFT